MKHFPYVRVAALILVSCAAVVAGYDALERLWYEIQGPFTWDTPIYWAVGRGILNGLVPYKDLFETKPPGIFFLSAFSFGLFGSPILGHVIDAYSIILYPVILGLHAWQEGHRKTFRQLDKTLLLLMGIVGGILIGLYTLERSGEYQVESFGAIFAVLYLAVITRHQQMTFWKICMAGLFIALSALMKEPFVLTMSAGALILCMDAPRSLLKTLILPMLFAGIFCVLLLAGTGTLIPYVAIYLPETLVKEVGSVGPLWSHFHDWNALLHDMNGYAFSMSALLIGCTIVLWLHPPATDKKHLHLLPQRILFCVLALYFAVTAVAMKGNFYNHQFVFAVPLYMAVLMAFMTSITHLPKGNRLFQVSVLTCAVLLLLSVIGETRPNYEERLRIIQMGSQSARSAATAIDGVLDDCGIDRYLFLGDNGFQPYGFTRHSPLGPAFLQFDHYLTPDHPYFRQTFLQNLDSTQLIVRQSLHVNDLGRAVDERLSAHFSEVPWPCAQRSAPHNSPGYRFYYRQN